MTLVLDCPITLAWCFFDEQTTFTRSILRSIPRRVALVPNIWPIETANVIAMAERKGRIDQAQSKEYLELLRELRIEIDSETSSRALTDILSLSRSHNLTAYDAAYLELAMRKGAELATCDAELLRAAQDVGVSLVES